MRFRALILPILTLILSEIAYGQVSPDFANINEDNPVTFSVTGNDSNVEGIDESTIDLDPGTPTQDLIVSQSEGTFEAESSGNVTFTPATHFFGVATIQYSVKNDLGADAGIALISVTVASVNDLPVAQNDASSTTQNIPVSITVVTNDSDVEGAIDGSTIDLNPLLPFQQTSLLTLAGTFEVISPGVVEFTPLAIFTGQATATYTVKDADGGQSNVATLAVDVLPNPEPVAVDDATNTPENTTVTIAVLANDSDNGSINPASVDLNPALLLRQTTFTTTGGTFTVDNAGVVTFAPASSFNGTATASYTVQDTQGATSNGAQISITVTAVNLAPVANDDNGSTPENVAVAVEILDNDTDDVALAPNTVDLQPATPGQQLNRSVTGGVFAFSGNELTFTPTVNFNGVATLTYTVEDNEGLVSNEAIVTITVTSVNPSPAAVNDSGITDENTAVNVSILANDTDDTGIDPNTVDLDPATPGQQTSRTVTGGTFTVASGIVTFTPVANFNGAASTTYTVQDSEGAISNAATITITINSVNPNPVATNDNATTDENVSVNITILVNDNDDLALDPGSVDLNPGLAGAQNSRAVTGGTFSVSGSGLVTFIPTANFNGTATVTYTVDDTEGATSNIATITVTVNSLNTAPVASNDAATTDENTPVAISIFANDTDDIGLAANTVDLDPIVVGQQTSRSVTGGTFSVNASGVLSFTPTTNYNGTAVVTYTVNDTEGATSNAATVTVTINSINTAPVASNDAVVTNENTAINIAILANDTDDISLAPATVDLNPGTAGTQTSRTVPGGTFTVNASGMVTFSPTTNVNGVSSITYTVNDGEGATSNTATITVTVNSVNAAPVANDDVGTTDENTQVTIAILSNDTDDVGLSANTVDLDPTLAGTQTTKNVTGGTFSVAATGILTFSPTTNYNGSSIVNYTVNDTEGAVSNIATVTITVNSVNTPPVATNDTGTTDEDVMVSISLLANDADDGALDMTSVDLDPGLAGVQSSLVGASGSFTVTASGILQYTPASNFTGPTSITYTVNDTQGLTSNVATVSITVNALNDPPIAANDALVTNEDVAATINILSNDTDSDGSLNGSTIDIDVTNPGLQNTRTTPAGTFSVNTSGILSFTPTNNYSGVSSIRYTVNDNSGSISNTATVTITVNAVNDLPVAVPDNATTDQGVAVNINVLSNDSDDNGLNAGSVDLNTSLGGIQNTFTNSAGNFTVSSSGVVTFSPTATFSGPTSITYTVDDTEGGTSNSATISITVNYVNQAPVAANDGGTTNEDVAITVNVVANDTDDGTVNPGSVDLNIFLAGIQSSNTTAAGTWTVSATGAVTFTPTANFSGAASLSYRVNDNLGVTSNNATITITIDPVNDPPVSVADSKSTSEDVSTTITVLTNDTDADNAIQASTVDLDPAVAGIQTSIDRAEGTWSVNASGIVTFAPIANFFGTATNSYTVNDVVGATSNVATITISVTAVNDVPIAVNDQASTPQNQSVTFNVTTNDLDVDGTISVNTVDLDPIAGGRQTTRSIASGTFTVDNSGNVTFVPTTNFNGSAGIQYSVRDNLSAVSSAGSITVLVNFVNAAPVANHDNVSTNEDTAITFPVLTNDTDDGSFASSTVDLNPSVAGIQNTISTGSGRFDVNTSGVVTFTPALNFNGSSTASYTVNDNIGETSNVAVITVTVNPVNDAATAVNDNANTNEDVAISINVMTNDSDIEGTLDPASIDLDTSTPAIESARTTAQGTFTVNTVNGLVTYTPLANFNGTATLTYTIQDNLGLRSNVATITVTVANSNDPPTFAVIPDQVILRNSATKSITITGISPGPQETEQIVLTTQSDNTPVVPNPTIVYNGLATTATLSFKPQPNQSGTATVTVKAFDSGLTEFSRTFTITVLDARITSTPITTAVKGELYQYDLQTTPLDPTLTFVVTQKPAWATLTSTGKNTARLSGTPPTTAPLSGLVVIQLREGSTVIDEQQFTIFLNQRPVVAPFAIETNEDNGLPLPIEKFVEGFTDPDNDPIDKIVFTQLPDPSKGILRLNNEAIVAGEPIPIALVSNIVYSPVLDTYGVDEFAYRAGDQRSLSDLAAPVTITINPVNDPPVITNLETEPLRFDIGLELAQIFTAAIDVKDVDSEQLERVEIGFRRPNFDELHDILEFSNTSKIKGEYDSDAGILILSGEATVEEYIQALRTVEYNFVDIEIVDNLKRLRDQPRTVYIRIGDGTAESEERERVINLEYTHSPLSIPNAFAPGSQNYGTWRIREKGDYATILTQYPDAEIFVFDKRGQVVFKSVGFEQEWDGTFNGGALPVDTYFYVINLNYGGVQYKGTVTIFREK